MVSSDPFAVLGIPATLESGRVKRAYFAQLQAHPPHSDPEGFRRLRQAYEALSTPGALALAYVSTPVDAALELKAWSERWEGPMSRALEQARLKDSDAGAISAFVTTVSRCTMAEAAAMFEGMAPRANE